MFRAVKRAWSKLVFGLRFLGVLPHGLSLQRMTTLNDFQEVARLRKQAYGRHYPDYPLETVPSPTDKCAAAIVFMVRCQKTGKLVGTMRLRHSLKGRAGAALGPDTHPDWVFAQGSFATMDRFAIQCEPSKRILVRLVLFSAIFHTTWRLKVDYLNCYARKELVSLYARIGFSRPVNEITYVGPYLFNLPHHFLQVRANEIVELAPMRNIRFAIARFGEPMPWNCFAPAMLESPSAESCVQELDGPVALTSG